MSDVYNNFVRVFRSRGNIRMLADTMQRNMILRDFKLWLLTNKSIFVQDTHITNIPTNRIIVNPDVNLEPDI